MSDRHFGSSLFTDLLCTLRSQRVHELYMSKTKDITEEAVMSFGSEHCRVRLGALCQRHKRILS
jgi:hypothetical protein